MRNKILLLLFTAFSFTYLGAQFVSESGDTLYGNEWINFDQEYFKIPVAEDGIYRITYEELEAAGVPVSDLRGENLQFHLRGEAYPIYVSNSGALAPGDYIEFYGRKNRGELDAIFYEDPETMQLNPEYSLFTDTAGYFITWNTGEENLRVSEVITDLSEDSTPAEPYYMHKQRIVQSNRNHKPTRNGADNVRFSHFDIGEGFGGNLAQKNEVTINANKIYEGGPDPSVDIRFTSNGTAHEFDFSVNGQRYETWKHIAYELRQETSAFPLSELRASNKITLEGQVDQFDRNVLAVVDLNYPRTFDFENKNYFEFFMPASPVQKRIEISNFKGGNMPIVYDPATGSRIIPELIDGKLAFLLPASTEDRNLIAYNTEDAVRAIQELEEMAFVNYAEMDHNYIIISHPKLMEGEGNKVDEYADYRSSADGGSFNTVVVNVEDLYEQFSYGIHRHSYSVKNFVNWAKKNWTDPEYVFIIGKGREYAVYRTAGQINHEDNTDFTVPTYGFPGSDNLLTSNGNNSAYAVISSGRLVAKMPSEIRLYLDKVIEHESFRDLPQTIEEKFWTKKIVHLSGGDPNIQEFLFNSLEAMRVEIEENQFAGSVETIRKYSSDIIQTSLSEGIIDIINNGVAMMTFFGHSAVGTFDFSIEDPSTYENKGKYPFMISLGCHSGNIHTGAAGVSEDFVIEADRGAISFLASSGSAYISSQRQFGIRLYEYLGTDYYGKSIVDGIRNVIKTWDSDQSIHIKILMEQLTYHGDPAIELQNYDAPDLIVDKKEITTNPQLVSTTIDSFELTFDVVNLGKKSVVDSVNITLLHYLPDMGLFQEKTIKIKTPEFRNTVQVKLKQPGLLGLGKNQIEIDLDSDNLIVEGPGAESENNNLLSFVNNGEKFAFFILDQGARPIYPEDHSIINNDCPFILKASTSNLFVDEQEYIFQIDTSGNFDSPFLQQKSVFKAGGVIEWAPDFQLEDERVYYWRISPDSTNAEIGYLWESSSFIYIENGEMGWNSSHETQFFNAEKETYKFAEDNKWEFARVMHDMRFDLGVNTTPGNWLFFDGNPNFSLNPTDIGSYFGIHARNLYQWAIFNEEPETVGALPTRRNIFAWKMDKQEDRKNFSQVLQTLPGDTRVFIYTILRDEFADLHTEDWALDSLDLGYNIFSVLEELGAQKIRDLEVKGTVPYLFVYDVNKGPIAEIIGDDIYSDVEFSIPAELFATEGEYKTNMIGPATRWNKVIWENAKVAEGDTIILNVFGYNEGDEVLLKSNIWESELDISDIDVSLYPNLKLELVAKDLNRTAPQINFIRVLYDGVYDLALNTNQEQYLFNRDTLAKGETLNLQIPVQNYSSFVTDSVEATFTIITPENQSIIEQKKFKPVNAKGETVISFERSTNDLDGTNQLLVNVNQENIEEEKYQSNNFGIRNFYVRSDERNPLIDVKFDGNNLINGDITSTQPLISIVLKDENKYLLLNDPDLIEIAIVDPEGNVDKFNLGDERVQFEAATSGEDNTAKYLVSPIFDIEGQYTLIVNGQDVTENKSGDLNYEVDFYVYLKQMISEVLNYPNPFSTSTQFVFTLTGDEVPEDLKITIMTSTGRIVKEIFKEELGPLKIGINRTQYKWDGRDEFGNRLANGVYLYQVGSKGSNQDAIENFDVGIGDLFKNGLGKMMILR